MTRLILLLAAALAVVLAVKARRNDWEREWYRDTVSLRAWRDLEQVDSV